MINSIASRGVMLVINMIAVRTLIAEEYGSFSYLLSIVASIATFSGLGSGVTTNTYLAKHREKAPLAAQKLVFSNIVFVTLLAVVFSLILMLFFSIDMALTTTSPLMLLVVVFLMAWMLNLSGIMEGALNGLGAYKCLANNSIITFCAASLLALALIKTMGLAGAFLALLAQRFLSVSLNAWTLRHKGYLSLSFGMSALKGSENLIIFRSLSLPATLGALMVGPALAASMKFVIEQPNGLSNIAYFSWVFQIYLVAVFVPSALGGYFISKFARSGPGANSIKKIFLFNLILSSTVAAALFFLKPAILGYAGASYITNSSHIFNLMMLSVVLYSFNATFASYWPATGKAWWGFAMNALWAITFISITWALASSHGANALAMGYLAAYAAQFGAQMALYNLLLHNTST